MPLTRDFKDTIKARAERDPRFRVALLEEALAAFLNADLETGKLLLRDYVNATIGFEALGTRLHKNPKRLSKKTYVNRKSSNVHFIRRLVITNLPEKQATRCEINLSFTRSWLTFVIFT